MNRNERRKLAKQQRAKSSAAMAGSSADTSALLARAQQQLEQGALQEAENTCQEILKINPSDADAMYLIGIVAYLAGQYENAVNFLKRATTTRPDFAEAYYNLGLALNRSNKSKQAETAYRKAIELEPNNTDYYNNLGNLLVSLSRIEDSLQAFRQALDIQPDHANILNNYGAAPAATGENVAAIAAHQKAITADPEFGDAYNNLGNALLAEGNLSEAIEALQKATTLQPNHARAHNNLGNALLDAGRPGQAVQAYLRSLEIDPEQPRTHSNLLYCYQYDIDISASQLIDHHFDWDKSHAQSAALSHQKHANKRTPNRRLRLGFVSPDFGRHPVGYFLIKLLENLDDSQFETICYADRPDNGTSDDLADRLRSSSTSWVNCYKYSDDKLADKIRGDKIDILFELSGHTKGNRLSLFALKPAPVQISWGIGYPGSTGLSAIDILLTDNHHVTPTENELFHERVVQMPDGVASYEPPAYAPPVSSLPVDSNGTITFGSFNQSRKINDAVLDSWAKILGAVADSRLLLKYTGLDDPANIARIEKAMTAHDVDPNRVISEGGEPHEVFLERYNAVDIGLDTFPYSGGITTCEALWMGVPVITFPGAIIASRHATSHLSTIGLTDMIAPDLDGYFELASQLAQDPDRLREIRAQLRDQMASSPLCDGPKFAQNFGRIMTEIWVNWCGEQTS